MAIKEPNTLPWFGTINNWNGAIGPGFSDPYPDVNNVPVSKGRASGHQLPWNLLRNDAANPVHDSFVNDGRWVPGMQETQRYCKANGMGFSFQLYYPQYDGAQSWSHVKGCAQRIAPYLVGYPVYVIIGNEVMSGSGFACIDQSPFSDLGGRGSTGLDGLINYVKELRKIFGSNCKLGINEYNACDLSVGTPNWNLGPSIEVYKKCAANGGGMDWFGVEGYWLCNNYSGFADPVAMINQTCNKFGDAVGVGIIYSECSLQSPNKGAMYWPKQIDTWKGVLGALVANPWVIGFTGPWGGIRYKQTWGGDHGENAKPYSYMYNDSGSSQKDPNGGSDIPNEGFTSTLTWLQGYIPTVTTGGGSPPIDPMPESPDGTTVLNDSGNQIVDSHSSVWTCVGGVAKKDGSNAGYSANVTKLVYSGHVVYQTNASGGWWKWTGSGWADSTNPISPPPGNNLASGTYTVPSGTKIVVP